MTVFKKPGPSSFPYQGNRSRHGQSNTSQLPRKNERIRVPEVRLIGPDNNQIGIVSTREALEMAKAAGLDLVEVSPTAQPPVCRILEYGKFMYEKSKKTKDSTKSSSSKLKEVKFRIQVDQHDYETKVRHAEEFLDKGHKLKITLSMRGRDLDRKHLGFELVKKAIEDLNQMGVPDGEPKLAGRNIGVLLTPLAKQKRKPKFIKEKDRDTEDSEE